MSPDFAVRATTPELMDTEDCGYETFRDCLVDLAAVNRLTLAQRPTLGFLRRLHREGRWPEGRPLRILDVGSGYGDMLRRIDRWADRRGLAAELTGLDLNPWSTRAATEATAEGRPIRWLTADAFAYDGEVDVVVSSLFAHHLDDPTLARFLAWMEAKAGIAWFVNDLHRLAFPYYGFALLAALMRWHRFVRHDGPVSISRAFRPADWRRLAAEAVLSLDTVEIAPRFPFRLCVARVRP
jgi:SAM-dependent methyltransferase